MATTSSEQTVTEPFPIFRVAGKYVHYDVNVISHVRKTYNICGVMIGGLPQAPQQNVFLGIPLELMPEETQMLLEKRVAYIVDDVDAHRNGYMGKGMSDEERRAFQLALRKQGQSAAHEVSKKAEERKKTALQQKLGTENWNDIPEEMLRRSSPRPGKKSRSTSRRPSPSATPVSNGAHEQVQEVTGEESLFASPRPDAPAGSTSRAATAGVGPTNSEGTFNSSSNANSRDGDAEAYAITPTTSYPPLRSAPYATEVSSEVPSEELKSYPLYKHMHDKGYFIAPGLRFGCQYMAYPGDPLRFHSHFLCNGMDWDREFDLLDIVGGGRLGTGVKKGFLIGGRPKRGRADKNTVDGAEVRAFCIEWGGM